jgi:type III pantothenate kinase
LKLVIDIGNSLAKLGVFDNDNKIISLHKTYRNEKQIIGEISNVLSENLLIRRAIISSVSDVSAHIKDFLEQRNISVLNFDSKTAIPVKNLYKTPETLGTDRLAAVIGANFISPGVDILVFDAGTALTADFINASGEYLGGAISPGLTMRFEALNHFTRKLPICEINPVFDKIIGDSTKSAITAGVQNGIVFEIEGYITNYKLKYPNVKVFLTGGDIFFFENKLKNNIFAQPDLLLIGLNRILEYNA